MQVFKDFISAFLWLYFKNWLCISFFLTALSRHALRSAVVSGKCEIVGREVQFKWKVGCKVVGGKQPGLPTSLFYQLKAFQSTPSLPALRSSCSSYKYSSWRPVSCISFLLVNLSYIFSNQQICPLSASFTSRTMHSSLAYLIQPSNMLTNSSILVMPAIQIDKGLFFHLCPCSQAVKPPSASSLKHTQLSSTKTPSHSRHTRARPRPSLPPWCANLAPLSFPIQAKAACPLTLRVILVWRGGGPLRGSWVREGKEAEWNDHKGDKNQRWAQIMVGRGKYCQAEGLALPC